MSVDGLEERGVPLASERMLVREVVVREDSTFFQGHFPGEPIWPGVAQLLLLVSEPAQKHWPELGEAMGLSKVKFRRPIRPNEQICVTLERIDARSVQFRVEREGEVVSSGQMSFDVRQVSA